MTSSIGSSLSSQLDALKLYQQINSKQDESTTESGNSTTTTTVSSSQESGKPPSGMPPSGPPPSGKPPSGAPPSGMKGGLSKMISSLSSEGDTETSTTLQSILDSLEKSNDDETTTSILDQLRKELTSYTQNNSNTYNQTGVALATQLQSLIDVKS